MEDLEYRRKDMIRKLVDSPLWPSVIQSIRDEYAAKMLNTKNSADRDEIFAEAQCLNRVVGKMTSIANEIRKLEKPDAT
jgi:predicted RNA-binding protein with EMAP domain